MRGSAAGPRPAPGHGVDPHSGRHGAGLAGVSELLNGEALPSFWAAVIRRRTVLTLRMRPICRLGAVGGTRTPTGCPNRSSYPLRLSPPPEAGRLESGLSLHRTPTCRGAGAARLVSTPSPAAPCRGLARDRHLTGFPEFEQFCIAGFPREHSVRRLSLPRLPIPPRPHRRPFNAAGERSASRSSARRRDARPWSGGSETGIAGLQAAIEHFVAGHVRPRAICDRDVSAGAGRLVERSY